MLRIHRHPTDRQLRQFAGLQVLFFAFVAFVLMRKGAAGAAVGVVTGSLIVGLVGYFKLSFMRLVFVGWMYLVFPIGWCVSMLLIVLLYYGMFTAMGCCMRLLGYDPLRQRLDPDATTYWEPHDQQTDPRRYFKQY